MANSTRTQNTLLKLKNQALYNQASALGGGDIAPKHHDSMIGHVLNILQRPKNAITRTVHNEIQAAKSGDIVGALTAPHRGIFTGGIMGKSKSFGDILGQDLGVKNRVVQAIGGLVGDVALDPLTYLSLGGAVPEEAAVQAAQTGRRLSEAASTAEEIGGALSKGKKGEETIAAGRTARKAVEAAGGTTKESLAAADVAKAAAKGPKGYARQVMDQMAADDKVVHDLGGPKLQIRGKLNPLRKGEGKLLTEIPLDKPFGGPSRLVKSFLGTDTGAGLAKTFSTASLYTKKGREFVQRARNSGAADWEAAVRDEIRPLFHGVSKENSGEILKALQGDKGALAVIVGDTETTNKSGQSLKQIHDALRSRWDDHFEQAVDMGIYKPEHYMENYVPHYFQEKGSAYNKFIRDRRVGKMVQAVDEKGVPMLDKAGTPLMKKVPKFTTADAAEAGLKPIDDLEQIAVMREAKHVAQGGHFKMTHAMLSEYGVHIPQKDAAKWAVENGFVKVTSKTSSHAAGALDNIVTSAKQANNYYIPERVANSLKNIDTLHHDAGVSNQLLRTIDKVQKPWKFLSTAANPGHHFKNLIGDMFLNYEDGVVDPRHYTKAFGLVGRDALPIRQRSQEAIEATRAGIKLKVGSGTIDGNAVMKLMNASGGRSGMIRQEFGQEGKGLKGAVEWIRSRAEAREDFGRVAHYMHALQEEGKDLTPAELAAGYGHAAVKEAADRAAVRIRHWNVDYGDLTPAERKYLNRAIPFYTFMRKNIPLQMEAIALRPARIAMLSKTQTAMEKLLGTEGQVSILPQYIQDTMHIHLRGEGEGHNSIYWIPSTPVEDMTKYFQGNIFANVLSNISPIGKVPIEEATGRQLYGSHAPIKSQLDYAAGMVPASRELNLLRQGGTGVGGRKLQRDQLINYLTGTGVQEVTPEEQRSELLRQRVQASAKVKALKSARRKKALGQ